MMGERYLPAEDSASATLKILTFRRDAASSACRSSDGVQP
jgi:hypothetical protein